MTYMATPEHQNPSPGGHEIYNFGTPFLGHQYPFPVTILVDPSLAIITIDLVCLIYAWE